ncbi:MAG: hypothetical protein WEC75_12200 [Dehalococcoidia bacterium]
MRRWNDLFSTHPSTERRIRNLQRLESSPRPPFPEDWTDVGDLVWLLPAARLGIGLFMAVLVPVLI